MVDFSTVKRLKASPDRVLMNLQDDGWDVIEEADNMVVLADEADSDNPVKITVTRKRFGEGTLVIPEGIARKKILSSLAPELNLNMNLKSAGPDDKEVQDSNRTRSAQFQADNLVQ